jgi:hypothetical protein
MHVADQRYPQAAAAELASESTFSVALAIWSDKEKIMLLLQSTLIELSSWRGQPLFWQRRRTSKPLERLCHWTS